MAIKNVLKVLTPPALWNALSRIKNRFGHHAFVKARSGTSPEHQELDVYWTPQALRSMEVWGEGNVWDEIQYLLVNLQGKVLDIACGTGKVMQLLSRFAQLEVHGFDISDLLINRALERGIARDRARVADATKMPYADNQFDYSYSIGSLEHFTERGIAQLLAECRRVTRVASFHQIPISRSGNNEGWLTTMQSFHNNSVSWWAERFGRWFPKVQVLHSRWEDPVSVGKWFVCVKGPEQDQSDTRVEPSRNGQ